MLAGWSPTLEQKVRAGDNTARIFIDGRALGAADLRQRFDQWGNLDSLPANAEIISGDSGVRLKATGTLGPNNTIINAYAQDKAALLAAPYIDPLQPDAGVYKTRLAALVQWNGARSPHQELTQVLVRLHPPKNPTKPPHAVTWRLDLYTLP